MGSGLGLDICLTENYENMLRLNMPMHQVIFAIYYYDLS